MDIAVLIKQTVDMDQIKLNDNNEPIMDNMPLKMDILSKNAVEAAVQLKEKYGGKVTGIIFGTDRSTSTMKEAYAMGVDEGTVITGYKKSDPMVTASVISCELNKSKYNIIILGDQSSDSYSGLLAGLLSSALGLNVITNAINIEINGETANVTVESESEDITVETNLPAIVSVAQEINEPRLPKVMQIMMAGKKNINIVEGKPEYKDDTKILSDKAPESQRKKIIYEDGKGIDEVAKILRVVK
ncbi:electron transfer flavoprotein subunit beta/FixA family protein [Ferroplasma sp.]|uniref:electron transfer flavoprotein subunit beta/FixA family protein n=1 Tax=Ferroplasma sp. TaxID=2591003 RepID=UPI00307EE5C5